MYVYPSVGKLLENSSDLTTAPVFVFSLALPEPLAGELLQHPGGVEGGGVPLSPGGHDEPLTGGRVERLHPWLQTGILYNDLNITIILPDDDKKLKNKEI